MVKYQRCQKGRPRTFFEAQAPEPAFTVSGRLCAKKTHARTDRQRFKAALRLPERGGSMTWIIVWAVVFVVMLLIELATAGLATVWFCAGSLVALVMAVFKVDPVWQFVAFAAVSILLLIFTRPIAKKLLGRKNYSPTNSDRFVGRRCITGETVDNLAGTGTVKVEGIVWSARSESGEVIPAGTEVTIVRIEGVKAVVSPAADIEGAGEQGAGEPEPV